MVVWLPNNKVMMVDLGSTKNKDTVTESSFKYFRDHTPFKNPGTVLDWLVLTHGDSDHYNMVLNFLDTFDVNLRNVLHGGLEPDYRGLIKKLRNRENPDGQPTNIYTKAMRGFFPLASTDDLGAEVTVVAIGIEGDSTNKAYLKNTRSVVLRIVYKGIGLLLTGDATADTELQIVSTLAKGLVAPDSLQANLLKVPHHGSRRTSNRAAFIASVNPNYAFISSDRSGSLAEEQKATGHRLPQAVTISLLLKYATRLQRDCGEHSYVMSYQKSDYEEYNRKPDVTGQPLPIPDNEKALEWLQITSTVGIFSTLAVMGLGTEADDDGSKDIGIQYRVTISDEGDFKILSTDEFEMFDIVGEMHQ